MGKLYLTFKDRTMFRGDRTNVFVQIQYCIPKIDQFPEYHYHALSITKAECPIKNVRVIFHVGNIPS